MSLDRLNSQIDKVRSQAASIQEQWGRMQRDVGRDTKLSDEGKRAELDQRFADLKQEIAELRAKEKVLVRDKKESLERSLFGLVGSDANKIIAYRDAQDRAARVKDKAAALEVYNSAQISDDDSLVKAILAKAVKFGYREIIDDYTRRKPVWREELNDLAVLERFGGDGNKIMQTTMAYAVLRGMPTGTTSFA
ncbi:hypothetical protein [Mycobacteroides salmoniphilum]|uniref:hypothetical protein n=1 Tax=Mycobacteroides salmoniphilum TaxID=404941 RepID=UPI00099351C0|nr:hypothetical protein [Mycobacteroides salmoniphilum]